MPVVRVDTYDGYLSSVLVKNALSPYSLLATIPTGAAIVNTGGGAYTVDVGSLSGVWMLILRDSSNATIGIKYASPTHLQAADFPPWAEGSTVLGPYAASLTVTDNGGPALPNIALRLTKGSETVTGTTDINGGVTFYLSAGTWSVNVSQPGYQQYSSTIVVTGDDSFDIELLSVAVTNPSDPSLCVESFFIWGVSGPLQNARVLARIEDPNAKTAAYLVSKAVHKGTTDATGLAQLQLIRHSAFTLGGVYIIEVFDSSNNIVSSRRVTVPNSSNINASDLIDVS